MDAAMKGVRMRKIAASIALASALMGLVVTQAIADAPKFFSADSSVNSNTGELVVTFEERGLGNGDVNYSLTADASATYACINGGNKNPSAANKRTVTDPVSDTATLPTDRNGRVRGTLRAGPPGPGDFSCPSGQRLERLSVSYTKIVLTDTTNGVSTDVPDAP